MSRGKKIYEGKAKILYAGPERGTYIQYFKDDATAFNNLKKAVIDGKGVLNNRISEFLLTQLNEMGIETHLIKRVNMREQLIKAVEIIPFGISNGFGIDKCYFLYWFSGLFCYQL